MVALARLAVACLLVVFVCLAVVVELPVHLLPVGPSVPEHPIPACLDFGKFPVLPSTSANPESNFYINHYI